MCHHPDDIAVMRAMFVLLCDTITRVDSRFEPSQWETALLCNDVSHWLGTSLESALNEPGWPTEMFCSDGWSGGRGRRYIRAWVGVCVWRDNVILLQHTLILPKSFFSPGLSIDTLLGRHTVSFVQSLTNVYVLYDIELLYIGNL